MIIAALRCHRHVMLTKQHHLFCRRPFHASFNPRQNAKTLLRPYQEDAINAILGDVNVGRKRLGLSLATGSGKTVVMAHLIQQIPTGPEGGTQTLILAHRRELVEQAVRHCSVAYPEKTVDVELGNLCASGVADITVASIPSITSKDRLEKFVPSRYKLIMVDEAHHIAAKSYLEVLNHFGLCPPTEASPVLLGISATFSRFDGLKIGAAIDHISYHKGVFDMIAEKWLSDVLFTTVEYKHADLRKVATSVHGDFAPTSLARLINTELNNECVFDAWRDTCSGRKSTLMFCVNVAHCMTVAEMFNSRVIDARYVTGSTKHIERAAIIDDFKVGKFPVLLNCGVFTEGTDIPNIDSIILARPTKSRNLLLQMIGRGLRPSAGKKNCHVVDMVTALSTGLVTSPTLFGLDPAQIVKNATIADMEDLKEKKLKEPPTPVSATTTAVTLRYKEYQSVRELIADTPDKHHFRQHSNYNWLEIRPDLYVLDHPNGYVRLSQTKSSAWSAVYIRRLDRHAQGSSPWARAYEIFADMLSLEHAIHAADTWISTNMQPLRLIDRYAPWRDFPASEGQYKLLEKLGYVDNDAPDKQHFTKGQVGDIIVKMRFGPKGRLKSRSGQAKQN